MALYTNHLPKVGASDDGTWRRLIVIPFGAKIQGKTDIKNYTDYLVENANPYIMTWVIDNRIYLGYMRMGSTYSPKQEHLQIIDEATWEKCQETVKGRATCLKHEMKVPERTDTRCLLSGLIFCADC